jgi:hypothetical protein
MSNDQIVNCGAIEGVTQNEMEPGDGDHWADLTGKLTGGLDARYGLQVS